MNKWEPALTQGHGNSSDWVGKTAGLQGGRDNWQQEMKPKIAVEITLQKRWAKLVAY
jgi:hypothetical protein